VRALESLMGRVTDGETGERGFLITGGTGRHRHHQSGRLSAAGTHFGSNVIAILAAMLAPAATMKTPGFALKEPE